MAQRIRGGVWPVMLTPYTEDGTFDCEGLEKLTDWYIKNGVTGLFSACQSSEIHKLTPAERLLHAKHTLKGAAGRVPVVASGHVADDPEEQLKELSDMAETGVDAVIIITNHLAKPDESDDVWLKNLEWLLNRLDPSIRLGLYECPLPYKRLMTEKTLRFVASTGRFDFLKDTCCDAAEIARRVKWLEGSTLDLYNANAATVLNSMLHGAAGFSGVMANFHPEVWAWLTANIHHENAQKVQDILAMGALIERQVYPVNAKYHLQAIEGLPISTYSRTRDRKDFGETEKSEVYMLDRVMNDVYERLCR